MAEDTQAAAISFLSNADLLGEGPIETTETHGSIVFLTPTRAFKLKKAVRYSYLDYSTLAKRRAACEKEMAINVRFAPQLYMGAIPIMRRATGNLALGGDGTPIDWVVAMRRFDSAGQFDRLAAAGGLTQALLRRLSDRIAAAHAQASPDPAFGGADAFRRIYDASLNDLRDDVAEGMPGETVETWAALALKAIQDNAALLDRRRADGRVRSVHGDLHLANICLIDGEPTLFDGIEFNPALSTIDLLYDLAFLLMDLWSRGLRREANLVFNRYFDLRDEGDGLPALSLFLSLRAAIRAQVTFAATRNAHASAGLEAKRAEAFSYLELAVTLLRPIRPRLIAVGGVSGTGKSTFAQDLAPWLGAAPGARALRSDVLRKRAFGVPPETRLPPEGYAPDAHRRTYRLLLTEVSQALRAGHTAIADAVFGRPEERDAIETTARDAGVQFDGVWLSAPRSALESRVEQRSGDASDATIAVVRAQVNQIVPPTRWIKVDAGQGPSATLVSAASALGVDLSPG